MSEEAAGYLATPAERVASVFKVACDTHCIELYATWPRSLYDGNELEDLIRVNAIAYPNGTGVDRAARLTHDVPQEFTRKDIEVTDTTLSCMRPSAFTGPQVGFQTGFRIALRPGMAASITDALDQLTPLLGLMKRVYEHADRYLSDESDADGPLNFERFSYAHGPAAELVRMVYFDGWDVESAAELAFEGHTYPPLSQFKSALSRALSELHTNKEQQP